MPRPSDFDLFWKDRMAEADAVGLDYAIETASVTDAATCQLFDLWYTGMCGARLHAKYLKPVSDGEGKRGYSPSLGCSSDGAAPSSILV